MKEKKCLKMVIWKSQMFLFEDKALQMSGDGK